MQQSHSFYHWYTVTYILKEVLSYSTRHHFSHISKQSFVICGHIKILCFNHHSFQSVIILNYRAVMSHITGGNNGRSPTLVGQGWQATETNLWAKLVLKKTKHLCNDHMPMPGIWKQNRWLLSKSGPKAYSMHTNKIWRFASWQSF